VLPPPARPLAPDTIYPVDTARFDVKGKYDTCRVRLLPDSSKLGADPKDPNSKPDLKLHALLVDFELAHEAFHCMQLALATGKPVWLTEGTAEWAAYQATNTAYDQYPGWIKNYIETPQESLFARAYDAVGFFAHVDDMLPGFFSRVAATYKANNLDAFSLAGGADPRVISTWGSSVFRLEEVIPPELEPAWTMASPAAVAGFTQLQPGGMTTIGGNGGPVQTGPVSTSQRLLDIPDSKPLIHVRVSGPARMYSREHGELQQDNLGDVWLRTDGNAGCPDGTDGTPPPSTPWSPQSYLGVASGPGGSTKGTVEPHALDEYCKPTPKRPPPSVPTVPLPPRGCSVNGGVGLPRSVSGISPSVGLVRAASSAACPVGWTNGDPHLSTFDDTFYDFQAAGEYTVVKSTTDDLEVQARQEPFWDKPAPRSRTVSVNTAEVMRVAGTIVEVDSGRSMVLRVGRRKVTVQRGGVLKLRGGGTVAFDGYQYMVRWPDGTAARVWPVSVWGLGFSMAPAPQRAGKLVGLLGNFNGDRQDDFVDRHGHRYDRSLIMGSSARSFTARYDRFGRTWLITQKGSLFRYPRAKRPKSYLIKGFPSRFVSTGSLSAAQRANSEKACRAAGVTEEPMLSDCILDVSVTRDARFATSAATLQKLLANAEPWTLLSSAPNRVHIGLTVASLAADGSSVVAAYNRASDRSVEAATFSTASGKIGNVVRATAITGFDADDPLLFPRAGGGLQLIVSGFHSTVTEDPLNGTLIAPRSADGTFGAPSRASKSISLAQGAVLAADGQTPLFTTNFAGDLTVNRGAVDVTQIDLSRFAPGDAYVPTLAYDATGRLWLAWYLGTSTASGLYLLELDPATGDVLPGATAQLAPGSSNVFNNNLRLPLACAQTCRFVYLDNQDQLISWAPGEAQPTVTLAKRVDGVSKPAAAYAPDGRLWVTWRARGHVFAKLGDPAGAGGTPAELPLPAGGFDTSYTSTPLAVPEGLVLVTNWENSHTQQSAEWAILLRP